MELIYAAMFASVHLWRYNYGGIKVGNWRCDQLDNQIPASYLHFFFFFLLLMP